MPVETIDCLSEELKAESARVRADVDKFFAEKKFWPRGSIPLTILLNAEGNVAVDYGSSKLPESFFIDRGFKITRRFVGAQNWTSQEIMKWIAENSK